MELTYAYAYGPVLCDCNTVWKRYPTIEDPEDTCIAATFVSQEYVEGIDLVYRGQVVNIETWQWNENRKSNRLRRCSLCGQWAWWRQERHLFQKLCDFCTDTG